jgi:hypothetical protein
MAHSGRASFTLAIGCILTVAASLEAYANELFSDRKKAFPEYSEELLHNLWETYEKKSVVEKFEFALLLRRKPNLNHGSRPVQDIDLLVQLRNALTHFKPELDTQADKHKKLSDRLGSKIKASPFFSSDALLFPRRWASHDCTTWAVHSAMAFAEHFEELAMFPPKYAGDHTAFQP